MKRARFTKVRRKSGRSTAPPRQKKPRISPKKACRSSLCPNPSWIAKPLASNIFTKNAATTRRFAFLPLQSWLDCGIDASFSGASEDFMLLINNQVVEQILDIKGCMEALETGYRDLIGERAVYRGRYDLFVPNDDPKLMYRWGTMEGASRSFETFAIRTKSDMLEWPEGKTVEKYCIEPGTFCGVVMVFSTRNGEPLAIINDGVIQHMRVGGCAGLGAKYLSREDSAVVGIFGAGGMARTYLLAFNEVRKLREVKVFSPTRANREDYARAMGEKLGIKITPVEKSEDAVRGCDIVATCTDS